MTDVPFENLKVSGFRGLRDLELQACGPVNLLVGGNNSGKTSLLEALLLLSDPTDVEQWTATVELRGAWPLADLRFHRPFDRGQALTWLFPRENGEMLPLGLSADGARPIRAFTARAEWIVGEPPTRPLRSSDENIEGKKGHRVDGPETGLSLELELVGRKPPLSSRNFRMLLWPGGYSARRAEAAKKDAWPVVFANPISHRSDGYLTNRVSGLIRKKRKEQALALLRELDPNLLDIVVVSPEEPEGDSVTLPRRGSSPSLHVEHAKAGLVPIHAMGDGTRRALHLAALLADVGPGGVLLVDELEVGMHTSVLRDVFGWLWRACEASKVQLFATTHSLEAVDCILESVPDRDLVLYRLGGGRARRFDGETLRTARVELGQEVR